MPSSDPTPWLWRDWTRWAQLTQAVAQASSPRWLAWQEGRWRLVGPRLGAGQGPCPDCLRRRLASHGHGEPQPWDSEPSPGWLDDARHHCHDSVDGFDLWGWHPDEGWRPHRLLAVPGCACATRITSRGGLRQAISPCVGLVSHLDEWDIPGQQGHMAVAQVAQVQALGSVAGDITGAACAAPGDREQAVRAALAEGLERYAAGFLPRDLPLCRANELGQPYLAPMPEAFGGAPLGDDSRLRWVRGQRLVNGDPCWVPAASVYFPYVCDDAEPPRSTGSSEGLAAGTDDAQAATHAALEWIERDSFMRAWRYGGRRWRLDAPGARQQGLQLTLIDNRFGVPVVAAFSEANALPFCVSGLAARLSVEEAVDAATREATGARALFDRVQRPAARRALESRYRHASDPALRDVRRWWLDVPQAPPGTGPRLRWDELVRRLPDAVAVDVATPDVRSLGLSVMRVVIPGCHGFEPVPGMSRLGGNPQPIPY